MMKNTYFTILVMAILTVSLSSCEPSIDLDAAQWGTQAEITDGSFIYIWQTEDIQLSEMTTGAKVQWITSSSVVDEATLTNTLTIDSSYDLTKVGMAVYHNGERVEPLNGAPKLGVIADFSAKEFVYRIHSVDGESKDWTIKIIVQ